MRELGGWLLFIHFLKIQACRYLALGIYNTLFPLDSFLRDFCLGFFQLIRLYIRFLNDLFSSDAARSSLVNCSRGERLPIRHHLPQITHHGLLQDNVNRYVVPEHIVNESGQSFQHF